MPVGRYRNFAACVAANQDKQSPEGWCAAYWRARGHGDELGAHKTTPADPSQLRLFSKPRRAR